MVSPSLANPGPTPHPASARGYPGARLRLGSVIACGRHGEAQRQHRALQRFFDKVRRVTFSMGSLTSRQSLLPVCPASGLSRPPHEVVPRAFISRRQRTKCASCAGSVAYRDIRVELMLHRWETSALLIRQSPSRVEGSLSKMTTIFAHAGCLQLERDVPNQLEHLFPSDATSNSTRMSAVPTDPAQLAHSSAAGANKCSAGQLRAVADRPEAGQR